MSAVRTSCPVTRAIPRRSAASRCQISRTRCWPGERSTVRLVRGLRVRPMAKGSVGAAATEGVSGVTAAPCVRERSGSALVRLRSGLICDLLSQELAVSMSVDQFQYIRTSGPVDDAAHAVRTECGRSWDAHFCCRHHYRLPKLQDAEYNGVQSYRFSLRNCAYIGDNKRKRANAWQPSHQRSVGTESWRSVSQYLSILRDQT